MVHVVEEEAQVPLLRPEEARDGGFVNVVVNKGLFG